MYSNWKDRFKADLDSFVDGYDETEVTTIKDCCEFIEEYASSDDITTEETSLLISKLVGFLTSDSWWLHDNILKEDTLKINNFLEFSDKQKMYVRVNGPSQNCYNSKFKPTLDKCDKCKYTDKCTKKE
jgi:hypothetical protein